MAIGNAIHRRGATVPSECYDECDNAYETAESEEGETSELCFLFSPFMESMDYCNQCIEQFGFYAVIGGTKAGNDIVEYLKYCDDNQPAQTPLPTTASSSGSPWPTPTSSEELYTFTIELTTTVAGAETVYQFPETLTDPPMTTLTLTFHLSAGDFTETITQVDQAQLTPILTPTDSSSDPVTPTPTTETPTTETATQTPTPTTETPSTPTTTTTDTLSTTPFNAETATTTTESWTTTSQDPEPGQPSSDPDQSLSQLQTPTNGSPSDPEQTQNQNQNQVDSSLSQSSGNGTSDNRSWIAGPVIGGLAAVAIMVVLYLILKRRRNRRRTWQMNSGETAQLPQFDESWYKGQELNSTPIHQLEGSTPWRPRPISEME